MREDRRQKWKSFTTAFLTTGAFLAVVMAVTVLLVQPAMPGAGAVEPAPEITYRPVAEDSLTLLVVGVDSQKQPADFLLIRFNPQAGQVPLSLLPPGTDVSGEGGEATLAQAFLAGGGTRAKNALSERLGIAVDRYAVLDRDKFITLAGKVGTVVFTLPYDISYTRDGFNVNLAAGERRLDGRDVADLFAYPYFRDGIAGRCQLLGDLVAAVVNQNLAAAGSELAQPLFLAAVNLVDTDVSSTDFELRRQAADFISKLDLRVAGNLAPSGTPLDSGAFELDEQFIGLLRQYFQTTR